MLTIRSFRNEDPPRLLALWRKTQRRDDDFSPLVPLSLNQLQMQVLGLPMLDAQSIMLAFDEGAPIGYVHTAFSPANGGYTLDHTVGQICFLCIDPKYPDVPGAAAALIRAGEDYLIQHGAKKIYGGSPSPSMPFYTAFYGGGEAVGILRSDEEIFNAFLQADYHIDQKTIWFHLDLRGYTSQVSMETVGYYEELVIEISEIPKTKTWWEGCVLTNGLWFDISACLVRTQRPVARLRTRVTYPDTDNILSMYGGTWIASLMELRVHPDFANKGISQFLLEELIRYLIAQNQISQVEAHVAEGSPLFALLLRSQVWRERDSGCLFVKELSS